MRAAAAARAAVVRAYKVTPDGTETLVRGLQFAPVPTPPSGTSWTRPTERRLYSYRATRRRRCRC